MNRHFPQKMKSIQANDPKSITYYFQTDPLRFIVQRANQITALEKMLVNFLPSEVIPYCQVMNISHQTLTLQLDNAVWATRVRYLVPNLIEAFSQQKMPIASIQCRVKPWWL
ncbi:DciA family protein [Coxiella endosymbiont of Amblyomma nuttalli]|uniref:DciA family protein n=1 Tax=Coxiella endosymbiont of Amblyomma nuttalli TaxID=2749996 RepID=UPI001BA774FC|nr:DciA family protein [Coxiella endosymbiont of Amblyomma nuttalli]QTS83763.1 hypothetical protein CEAn_00225 [Coxiella endosymbiont of Amblyomma nuttalli]